MLIGVLTYYRVANFGANLQALSTYKYLEKSGHTPIFIHYMSKQLYESTDGCHESNAQIKVHFDFIDKYTGRQTEICFSADDINCAIDKYSIEAIIVGSDAVLQHHPLLSRIYMPGHWIKRHFYIDKVNDERLFPNLFWGIGINPIIPIAMMSVSSQNSEYKYFSPWLKVRMRKALRRYSYISVRDRWTQEMLKCITGKMMPITPDPVFAFNRNASELIPDKQTILTKFGLPDKYVLISFLYVNIPEEVICQIKEEFKECSCVAFPTPKGIQFKHNYKYKIDLPLNPLDWYALIKYSQAFIGSNMHPIVVALANSVPCYSVDFYCNYNFLRHPKNDGASKVLDVLKRCGVSQNYIVPFGNNTYRLEKRIHKAIISFPKEVVSSFSQNMQNRYFEMMENILNKLQ